MASSLTDMAAPLPAVANVDRKPPCPEANDSDGGGFVIATDDDSGGEECVEGLCASP